MNEFNANSLTIVKHSGMGEKTKTKADSNLMAALQDKCHSYEPKLEGDQYERLFAKLEK